MPSDDTNNIEEDPLTQLARVIYGEMNVEPRRMHVAIDLAKQILADIRRILLEQALRTGDETKLVESENEL